MGNRISREELLSEIHRLNDKYGKATTTLVREHGEYSSRTYNLRFGSWSNALKEAGLDTNREQNITDEMLIEELQRLADDLGRTPTMSDMKESGRYSRGPYQDHFGSWNDGLKEAGLTPNVRTDISKSDLIDEMRRLADELGRPPRKKEMTEMGGYGSATYKRTFGSWSDAIVESGLELSNRQKRYTEEELLEDLHRLSAQLNVDIPSTDDMKRCGEASVKTYQDRFGSWSAALEEAGFELPTTYDEVDTERLCKELNEVAERIDRVPKRGEMCKHSDFSTHWYYRDFGSWNAAIREAGLEPPGQPNQYSDEELLSEVNALADQLGRVPRQSDMEKFGQHSVSTFKSRFGSWNQTLEECGFEPVHRYNIGKEELLDALTDLADRLNQTPSAEDMNEEGKFSERPYFDQFGSWIGALESAGLDTPLRFEEVDRDELIDEIKHISDVVERVPKIFDVRKHSEVKSAWYAREFGSWNEALRQTGFDPHRNHDITDGELVEELQRVAEQLGQTPTIQEFSIQGKYRPSLYIHRFDSWNNAGREAGLEPVKRHDIPDGELENEFHRLVNALEHVPSGREMNELGGFSKPVYGNRFGTWNEAVRAFGEEPRYIRSGDRGSQSYGRLWEERREEIIQRDKGACIVCGFNRDDHMEEFGRDFGVHHIIPFLDEYERTGDYEVAHRPENLVTVCVQCHMSVEGRSKEYFKKLVPEGVLEESGHAPDRETVNTTLDEFL
jgi:hypothetical protein